MVYVCHCYQHKQTKPSVGRMGGIFHAGSIFISKSWELSFRSPDCCCAENDWLVTGVSPCGFIFLLNFPLTGWIYQNACVSEKRAVNVSI